MDMTIIKKKYTVGSLVSYSVKEFLEDINLIWSNAMTYFPVLSPIYVAAKHISLWFASVVSRWQLSHLTVKTSTAHRPADASHPVSTVALRNSSVTHPACWYPEFVNLAYSRERRELPASKNETPSDGSNKNTPNNSDAANNTKKWNVSVEYDVEGLGKYSPPDSKIQSPVTFGHVAIPAVDPYCSCKEINNLQTCFYLLLLQEPDSWTKESRIQFLTTVLNFCTWSHSFRSNMRKMNADIFNNTAADTIPDVGDAPVKRYQNINLEPIPAAKLIKSAPVTCHFTGIDIRYVDMTMQWVVVPDELPLMARLAGTTLASKAAGYVAARYTAERAENFDAKWSNLIGCNMAFRKPVIAALGGFDVAFDLGQRRIEPREQSLPGFRQQHAACRAVDEPDAEFGL